MAHGMRDQSGMSLSYRLLCDDQLLVTMRLIKSGVNLHLSPSDPTATEFVAHDVVIGNQLSHTLVCCRGHIWWLFSGSTGVKLRSLHESARSKK